MIKSLLKIFGGENLVSDYDRYVKLRSAGFIKLMIFFPEFRYQLLYRLRNNSLLFRVMLAPLKLFNSLNLYINCKNIGKGLFIEHGFSTIISCRYIGENCWINQQVTIGYSDAVNSPYIGNNVNIKAGAKVIGGVTIGDDVVIGANAVVVNDIPSHSIVVGIPAKVIKRRKDYNSEWVRVKN